ncbi:MAG TPA: AAA family ATPase [Myxococcota bacterium]|nr:AAA family ATPase [Myxococcota bacterium]
MYTAFYGLREKPFQLSPDPRFLFLAESHREALAHLLFGVEQGEGFICVTGEVGTGKTTLCRTLVQRLGPGCEVALIFHPQLSAQELLEAICIEFSLDIVGRSNRELMDELNRFLLERKQQGRRVLLLVDEAQALGPDALEQIRMLSNLETETEKLIQIVLLGQPEFDAMLESPSLRQLRQRISVRWRLAPLSASETAEYVRHRLRVAAGARRELFSEVALREVHRRSGGIPRLVNLLCDRSLLAGYAAGAKAIGLPFVAQADRELRGGPGAPSLRTGTRPAWRTPRVAVAAGLAALALAAAFAWRGLGGGSPTEADAARVETIAAPGAAPETGALAEPEPSAAPAPAPPDPGPAAALATPAEPAPPPPDLDAALAGADTGVTTARALDAALESWDLLPARATSLSLDAALAELRARGLVVEAVNEVDSTSLAGLGHPALVVLAGLDGEPRPLLLRSVDEESVGLLGLLSGGEVYTASRREFDARVAGEALLLWRDFEALPPLLRAGSRGPAVGWLQESLAALGFLDGPASGFFDEATAAAVRAFQSMRGLRVDGEVGPRTKMALYAELERYAVPRLEAQHQGVG